MSFLICICRDSRYKSCHLSEVEDLYKEESRQVHDSFCTDKMVSCDGRKMIIILTVLSCQNHSLQVTGNNI